MKRSLRSVSNLSEPLSHRLSAYTLAAGAAGVGALALAHPAEAKIIYNPANIPILQNGQPVELDLNHDGINDFQFTDVYSTERRKDGIRGPEGYHQSSMNVAPAQQSNRIVATKQFKSYYEAAALHKGKTVGPNSPFQPGNSALEMWACAGGTSGGGCGGAWLGVKQAYLGLKFMIKGKTHYGWAHVRFAGEANPTIVGYAYETIPNKPILTGDMKGPSKNLKQVDAAFTTPTRQPASLGLLALGAPGLSIWRRKESTDASQ
ncbi:MAG TPA: hypothetical protein VN777_01380 [Terriglobales bacterium]|nr:hypothetical protein [Terriglobales bacterium]